MLGAQGWPPAQLPECSCGQLRQSFDLTAHGNTVISLMPRKAPLSTQDRTKWVEIYFELDGSLGLGW